MGHFPIQRFKALKAPFVDGNWSIARRHELILDKSVRLAGPGERKASMKLELQRMKLQEGVMKKQDAGSAVDTRPILDNRHIIASRCLQ